MMFIRRKQGSVDDSEEDNESLRRTISSLLPPKNTQSFSQNASSATGSTAVAKKWPLKKKKMI